MVFMSILIVLGRRVRKPTHGNKLVQIVCLVFIIHISVLSTITLESSFKEFCGQF